jgi:hypothetical protein
MPHPERQPPILEDVRSVHHQQISRLAWLDRRVVAAFLAASRDGDFAALLALLDPDAVAGEVPGAHAVAATFAGRAHAARLTLVDGVPAAVWAHRGPPEVVFTFIISDGKITRIAMDDDQDRLSRGSLSPFALASW